MARNEELQKVKAELQIKSNSEEASSLKLIQDDLKKKNQLVMIKDAEIDSLKATLKDLRSTLE